MFSSVGLLVISFLFSEVLTAYPNPEAFTSSNTRHNKTDTTRKEESAVKDKISVETLAKQVKLLQERDIAKNMDIENLRINLQKQQRRCLSLEKNLERVMEDTSLKQKRNGHLEETDVESGEISDSVADGRLERQRRSVHGSVVAFFATRVTTMEHVGIDQPVVFENDVTNIGNSYSNHTGLFVAPVGGVYVFSTSLFTPHKHSFHASFVRNGQVVTTMYAAGAESSYDTTSHTIVLRLQKGDDVCVQNKDNDRTMSGGAYSIFSGYLLQEVY